MWPLEKTMALGGVPMGIMEAQLAARVMGMPNIKGLTPIASAMPVTTGANTITWATLLITSLIKIDSTATATMSKSKELPENPANHFPSIPIRPAFSNAVASVMPPPNSNKIPQAIFEVSAQTKILPADSFEFPEGTMNINKAPNTAIMLSSSLTIPN